ncbi:MAG: hypothetical protein ABSE89_08700 [Sedimentisphaerales bacterium]
MVKFIPKTVLGKWSVALIVIFFLLAVVLKIFFISGQWASDTVKLLASGITAVVGVGAFFTGIIGVIKSKEGAILVFLSTVIGFLVLMFLIPCLGEAVSGVVGYFEGPTPIPQDKQAFVGVWKSESGFQLEIKAEGLANIRQIADHNKPDCKALNIGVAPQDIEGMRVKFTGDNGLEVVSPGNYGKVYHIDRTPFVEDGRARMVLNGVTFTKD